MTDIKTQGTKPDGRPKVTLQSVAAQGIRGASGRILHDGIRVEADDAPVAQEHVVMIDGDMDWHPTWIPHTDPTCYLTALSALNLTSLELGPKGDWHHGMWWCPVDGVTGHCHQAQTSNSRLYAQACGELMELLGHEELCDARSALEKERHPAAKRGEIVWSATHVRAIIEDGWRETRMSHGSIKDRTMQVVKTIDPSSVRRWLATDEQWQTLHAMAKQIGAELAQHHGVAEIWEEWRVRLSPHAHYTRPDIRWENR